MLSSRIYYINSLKALSGSSSNFSYKVQIPAESKFDRVCVLGANIPISYYNIQAGYNHMSVIELGVSRVITMVSGNYSASTFATVLAALLTSSSLLGWVYTVAFPNGFSTANTGKFTFTVSSNTGQPSFQFDATSIYEQMGFNIGTYTMSSNQIVSPNVVGFMPESNILIHSDIVDGDDDILQEVFNGNNPPLSNVIYQCADTIGYSRTLRTNQSSVYHFSITDEHNNQLELNGRNLLISLILFKKDDWSSKFREFMKFILSNA